MKTSKYGGYLELELSGDEVEERRADGLVGIFAGGSLAAAAAAAETTTAAEATTTASGQVIISLLSSSDDDSSDDGGGKLPPRPRAPVYAASAAVMGASDSSDDGGGKLPPRAPLPVPPASAAVMGVSLSSSLSIDNDDHYTNDDEEEDDVMSDDGIDLSNDGPDAAQERGWLAAHMPKEISEVKPVQVEHNGIVIKCSNNAARAVLSALVSTNHLFIGNVTLPHYIHEDLIKRLMSKNLFYNWFSAKKILSSGYGNWSTHAYPILREEAVFEQFIDFLRLHGWVVIDGYLLLFTVDGEMALHSDKKFYKKATHRFTLSVGESGKVFQMRIYYGRKAHWSCSLNMPHGGFIGMSAFTAGVTNKAMKHCVMRGNGGAMTLVVHCHQNTE